MKLQSRNRGGRRNASHVEEKEDKEEDKDEGEETPMKKWKKEEKKEKMKRRNTGQEVEEQEEEKEEEEEEEEETLVKKKKQQKTKGPIPGSVQLTWMVWESLAWPRISRRAGSDTKKKRGKTRRFFSRYPVRDFWQISSCSSRWGRSWDRVSSPTQHCTTLGFSWARCMIFCQDLSMLAKRLASWKGMWTCWQTDRSPTFTQAELMDTVPIS